MVSEAQPPVRDETCESTLKRAPESRFLSSLQDNVISVESPAVRQSATAGYFLESFRINRTCSTSNGHARDFALNQNLTPHVLAAWTVDAFVNRSINRIQFFARPS